MQESQFWHNGERSKNRTWGTRFQKLYELHKPEAKSWADEKKVKQEKNKKTAKKYEKMDMAG